MSRRTRATTGSSRSRMDDGNTRQYEVDNPDVSPARAGEFRSSNACDIFRDHGFEESLHIPTEKLNRLSYHNLEEADPSDVPLPLNIRKTPTPGNTPLRQEHGFSEGRNNEPGERPRVPGSIGMDAEGSAHAIQGDQAYSTYLQENDTLPGSALRRTVHALARPTGAVFSTSQVRNVSREQTEEFPEPLQRTRQVSPSDGVQRCLPRQRPVPLYHDPDAQDTESIASFETVTQEHYSSQPSQTITGGLRGQGGHAQTGGFLMNWRTGENQFDQAEKVQQTDVNNDLYSRSDLDEDSDEEGQDRPKHPFLVMLDQMFGPGVPDADLPQQNVPSSLPIEASRTTPEQRMALALRPPSSIYEHRRQNSRPTLSSASLDSYDPTSGMPPNIAAAYRQFQDRRAAGRYTSVNGEHTSSEAGTLFPGSGRDRNMGSKDIGNSVEVGPSPNLVRRRPDLMGPFPTRIPRPSRAISSSCMPPRKMGRDVDCKPPEQEGTSENVNLKEEVPESPKEKIDKGKKGKEKATSEKSKKDEKYDIDPWALMVAGSSTPHRAQKKNKKEAESQSESHRLKITPSSTHSKNSKHSDQPSSSSDKRSKTAKLGLAKPSPIKTVLRRASGILPKIFTPSGLSQSSASESHRDSKTSNRLPDINTQEQEQQRRLAATYSPSPQMGPPTRLRSTTVTSPSPFRTCSRPELGFPSSPDDHNLAPQFSPSASRHGLGYRTMEPPSSPPPPIPTQLRSPGGVVPQDPADTIPRATGQSFVGVSSARTSVGTWSTITDDDCAGLTSEMDEEDVALPGESNTGSNAVGCGSTSLRGEGNVFFDQDRSEPGETRAEEERVCEEEVDARMIRLSELVRSLTLPGRNECPPAERLALLRMETGCEYKNWADEKFEKRPDDDRVWHSKNLRCKECSSNCYVCGAACCIWSEAMEIFGDDSTPEPILREMGKLLQNILDLLPEGVDPKVRVQCSASGGCGGYACPNCTGRCPTALCQDILCKNCKPDPWGHCDWHAAE